MTADWVKLLSSKDLYEQSLQQVVESAAWKNSPEARQQNGCTLSTMRFSRGRLSRAICRDIVNGDYQYSPGVPCEVKVKEKIRTVYQFVPTDRVVNLAVTTVLNNLAEQILVKNVYSYRNGYSYIGAVQDFARYIRSYRAKIKDPRDRGLYVVRSDISSYFDSIPTGANSPLWTWLRKLLGEDKVNKYPELWNIFQQAIHPLIVLPNGGNGYREFGVPTGSPVSNAIANLYLAELDARLAAYEDSFYARYGDDIIFANSSDSITDQALADIKDSLNLLGLSLNEKKTETVFFNGAGRSSANSGYRGNNRLEFLGFSIDFHGTISIKPKRINAMLAEFEACFLRLARLVCKNNPDPDKCGPIFTRYLNILLNPAHPGCHPYAKILRTVVTDRPQLQQLDYRLIRLLIYVATGTKKATMLKKYPPSHVRQNWHYQSLVTLRNNFGKHKTNVSQ